MIRKTTAAALVLSAVPAALALSLFSGTAVADDDTPWVKAASGNTPWGAVIASDDTPWRPGFTSSDDDTPWRKTVKIPAIPNDDDTPWR
jgi:hypothetical protein